MAETMHILILNWRCPHHPQAGGAEVNLFEQARRWVRAGHQVTLLSANTGTKEPLPEQEQLDGIQVQRMGGRFTVYLFAALFLLFHGHEFDRIMDISNGIPFFSPLFTRTPSVLLVHHVHEAQWFTEFPSPIAAVGWFIESRVVPWLYRHHPIIAVSPTTHDALVALGFRPQHLQIIYNGTNHPPKEYDSARCATHHIAYVGRLKRYKRLDRLVLAVSVLQKHFPELHLDLAGDGDAAGSLRRLIKKLGLQDRVTLHGYVSEEQKAQILSCATVFATPSMHEGWGLSVIEANAYGCPAVAYNVPGLRVAIQHGKTGLLAGDEKAFEDALAAILRDTSLREQLSVGARRWASRFDWDSCARSTLHVLRNSNLSQGRALAA